jgi:hypothetical protein
VPPQFPDDAADAGTSPLGFLWSRRSRAVQVGLEVSVAKTRDGMLAGENGTEDIAVMLRNRIPLRKPSSLDDTGLADVIELGNRLLGGTD